MTIHRIETVHDALRIVLAYDLDPWYMKAGTTRGFANWLFVRHSFVSTEGLAELVDEYEQEHIANSAHAVDLDKVMQRDADCCMSGQHHLAKEVNGLIWLIKEIKSSGIGVSTWDAIALLATTDHEGRGRAMNELASEIQLEASKVLTALEEFEGLLKQAIYHGFAPSDWQLSEFVRAAIRRLDVSLAEDSMWVDDDVQFPIEFSALWRLVEAHKKEGEANAWLADTPALGSA